MDLGVKSSWKISKKKGPLVVSQWHYALLNNGKKNL